MSQLILSPIVDSFRLGVPNTRSSLSIMFSNRPHSFFVVQCTHKSGRGNKVMTCYCFGSQRWPLILVERAVRHAEAMALLSYGR